MGGLEYEELLWLGVSITLVVNLLTTFYESIKCFSPVGLIHAVLVIVWSSAVFYNRQRKRDLNKYHFFRSPLKHHDKDERILIQDDSSTGRHLWNWSSDIVFLYIVLLGPTIVMITTMKNSYSYDANEVHSLSNDIMGQSLILRFMLRSMLWYLRSNQALNCRWVPILSDIFRMGIITSIGLYTQSLSVCIWEGAIQLLLYGLYNQLKYTVSSSLLNEHKASLVEMHGIPFYASSLIEFLLLIVLKGSDATDIVSMATVICVWFIVCHGILILGVVIHINGGRGFSKGMHQIFGSFSIISVYLLVRFKNSSKVEINLAIEMIKAVYRQFIGTGWQELYRMDDVSKGFKATVYYTLDRAGQRFITEVMAGVVLVIIGIGVHLCDFLPRIIFRKYWHVVVLIAVLIPFYLDDSAWEGNILSASGFILLSLLIITTVVMDITLFSRISRSVKIKSFCGGLESLVSDQREGGAIPLCIYEFFWGLLISPVLISIIIPMVLYYNNNNLPIEGNTNDMKREIMVISWLTTCVGDTMASTAGVAFKKYLPKVARRFQIFNGKTLIGGFSNCLSCIGVYYLLSYTIPSSDFNSIPFGDLLKTYSVYALIEMISSEYDNAIGPIIVNLFIWS